jgi:hypothetical protein
MKIRKGSILTVLILAAAVAACTPSQEQQWMQLIGVLVSAVPEVVPLLATNPQAQNAANQAASDYKLAQSVLQQYQADSAGATSTLGKVTSALNDAQSNLDGILAAVHVTSAASQDKVQAAVNLAIAVTQELIADMPSSAGEPTLGHVTLPKPADVQQQFNQIFAH